MTDKKTFYLTTAIFYVNGAPHLGHAYDAIACFALARFKGLDGYDVMFLSGTYEYGEKNARTAAKEGIEPQAFVDRNAALFEEMTDYLDISNDDFLRTSQPRHHAAAQAIWQKLADAGDIYRGSYEGWYSVRDEAYFTEDELTKGEGGAFFAPSGAEVEWVEEDSYFFRLSQWADKLLALYEANPDFIQPQSRRNEVISFVKSGLRDLSVSRRRLKWGIPVPGDPDHVLYVWLDALTNYITGLGDPDTDSDKFRRYWPADFHFIGKDIVRFHTVYWPAFLMAAGIELPKRVFCHGFLNIEGEKMSKSLGNVLAPRDMIGRYGLDQMRYFLLREVPFGQDGSFSHESIVNRINSDLANDLGNLAQRILSMINKNCDGQVPTPGDLTEADTALLDAALAAMPAARELLDADLAFHNALAAIWNVVGDANRYVDAQAPWTLRKTDPDRMATVLYVVAETVRRLAILVQPFVPTSAAALLDLLAVDAAARSFAALTDDARLQAGTALPKPQGVFPRYVDEPA
ncbi:MAG: methionine--tRNA ligase [Alphaproteobacteria bacterium]